jgi:hypothetical protein
MDGERIHTVLEVFHAGVPRSFGFLADEFGFRMTRDDDYAFSAIAAHSEVLVELDWGAIVVSIRPAETGRSVRLSFIVGALDADVLFLPRYPWGPDEVRDEIERQAGLLRRYCDELLRGDFSNWAALEEHQHSVHDQWRRESERLVREARVKLVRRRAQAAFAAKRFSEAAQLWSSIREDLDAAESRSHEYARRRVLLQPVRPRPRFQGIA